MLTSPDRIAEFIFYGVLACWFLFALTFMLRKRPAKGSVARRDNSALLGIGLQMVGFFLVWFRRPHRGHFLPAVQIPLWAEVVLGIITLAIALGSIWMVNAAVRHLGKQWAVPAQLVEGHQLVTSGPYGLVRNPIYAGMFGMLIATGLAASRWYLLVAACIIFFIGTYIRVETEEKLLRSAFGSEFDDYARRVPALIPGIY